MKIYLAARFSRRSELVKYAEMLRRRGHEITSRWLNEPDEDTYESMTMEKRRSCAVHDWEDVVKCDLLIAFTEGGELATRGGRHVEYGIALATGKNLMIVGPFENIFHCLMRISQFGDFESCYEAIGF